MKKLRSLADFQKKSKNYLLKNSETRCINGGSTTSTIESISTDQGAQHDTDCGERETFDSGLVIVWIAKN